MGGAEFLDAENEFFYDKAADELYLYCPPPAGAAFKRPSGVPQQIGFVYCAFYGRAGRLTAKNGGFRPGQSTGLARRRPSSRSDCRSPKNHIK